MKLPYLLGLPLCLSVLPVSPAHACQMRFAYDSVGSAPWAMGSDQVPAVEEAGVAVELVAMAAREAGCQASFQRMPTKRVMAEVASGNIDGGFMYSHNAERATTLVYPLKDGQVDSSRRITDLSYYLYRMKNGTLEWDGERFSQVNGPIGYNLGWSIGKDLQAKGVAVEEAPTAAQNLAKLRLGRIAGYATQEYAGDAAITRLGISDVIRLPQALSTKAYYVVFSQGFYRRNTAQVERFWSKLGSIRDGNLPRLLAKYPDE